MIEEIYVYDTLMMASATYYLHLKKLPPEHFNYVGTCFCQLWLLVGDELLDSLSFVNMLHASVTNLIIEPSNMKVHVSIRGGHYL